MRLFLIVLISATLNILRLKLSIKKQHKQDFFKYLPADVVTMILLTLPIGSIIRCKYVCKSLRDLIETFEFCKSHYLCNSESVPGLAAQCSKHYNFYNFVEKQVPIGGEYLSSVIAFKFTLPIDHEHVDIHSSVNGLLLFSDTRTYIRFVCNPVTGEYIMLPWPRPERRESCGFGVSKVSGEYKIVRVFSHTYEVYTLGTGSWRSVAPCSYHHKYCTATFVNGNLHWLLLEHRSMIAKEVVGISCFDLDIEILNTFSLPPNEGGYANILTFEDRYANICTFEECLAFCNTASEGYVIWLKKEYGDDKSWTRKLIIPYETGILGYGLRFPVNVLNGGDVLMARRSDSRHLIFFIKTSNTTEFSEPVFKYGHDISGWSKFMSYTPSFLSLKSSRWRLYAVLILKNKNELHV